MKEICTSTEPNGDGTWNYRIELERKYSLNEFIEYVLREKPQEWGNFFIVDGTDTKKIIKELRGMHMIIPGEAIFCPIE